MLARDMQTVYGHELARRALLTDAQRRPKALTLQMSSGCHWLVDDSDYSSMEDGGCGKTRIINAVLVKLFRRFYGPRGLVLSAFASKPARLIGGTTTHGLIKRRGGQSVSIAHLRVKTKRNAEPWQPSGLPRGPW